MDIQEIKSTLTNHEKRLKKLEGTDSRQKKPSKRKSIVDLMIEVKDEGFFSKKRRPKEILHRFSEKGHTYKRAESLTGPLQRATKQGIIKREKTPAGWVYYV